MAPAPTLLSGLTEVPNAPRLEAGLEGTDESGSIPKRDIESRLVQLIARSFDLSRAEVVATSVRSPPRAMNSVAHRGSARRTVDIRRLCAPVATARPGVACGGRSDPG